MSEMEELERKAKDGDAEAMFQLGNAYAFGKGVQCSLDMTLYWLKCAAFAGHKDAKEVLKEVGVYRLPFGFTDICDWTAKNQNLMFSIVVILFLLQLLVFAVISPSKDACFNRLMVPMVSWFLMFMLFGCGMCNIEYHRKKGIKDLMDFLSRYKTCALYLIINYFVLWFWAIGAIYDSSCMIGMIIAIGIPFLIFSWFKFLKNCD